MRSILPLLAVLAGGCAVPKLMIGETFIPEHHKAMRATVKPVTVATKEAAAGSTTYYVQVCDVVDAQASNCKTTEILTGVTNFYVRTGFGSRGVY